MDNPAKVLFMEGDHTKTNTFTNALDLKVFVYDVFRLSDFEVISFQLENFHL